MARRLLDPRRVRTRLAPRPSQSWAGALRIEGVRTDEWAQFVGRVSRELPTYQTASHVGQFRQRLDRVLALGYEPAVVASSPEAQVDALGADMADAYRHAHARGLLGYVGTQVEFAVPGAPPARTTITGSGVLGVVQAAGVEGAQGWFGSPVDRTRYPNTTAAFARTNGVF